MTLQADIARLQHSTAAGIGFLRRPGQSQTLPLVLLHGIGSNAESFAALTSAMPLSLDVVAWDAPGYAQSTALSAHAPTPRDYAAALASMLDALKHPRISLVGHSLGCLFAGSFAANYPQRVSAIAFISPALGYKVAPGAALPASVQSRIDEIEQLGPKAFAAKRASRLVAEPQTKPTIVAAVEKAMAAVNPPGYAQAVRALGAGDLLSDAGMITAPATVLVGQKDVVTPPDNARALHAALASARGLHEIPDAGHALPQEQPQVVARILEQFLEEHVHA